MPLEIKLKRCEHCHAEGTIVEMGLCCKIRVWQLEGPNWELRRCPTPTPQKDWRRS